MEGYLAHCSIFDMKNNVLLNEAVINGGTYKLLRFGEVIFLDDEGFFWDSFKMDFFIIYKSQIKIIFCKTFL